MSEFASYESEFTHACMDANSKISTLERLAPGSGRDAAVKEAQAAVDSAADVVSRLEMEAGPSDRGRVRECKSSLSELRSKLSVARSNNRAAELAREQLLASADAPARMEAEAQHARLLETTSRMQRGTDKLRAACQVAVETEAVGVSILGDLDQQRMTLEQTRERLRTANRGLERSKKLLQSMTKRAAANKMLMIGIIAFLCLMIVAILYLKFFMPSGSDPSPPPSPPPPQR
ncbi:hypothetical protein EMIHUDRAFT_353867, partial [Emiliania huxleyi CCMP1516]|uniref:Vesicle transport v-SNARE N-terminal domain-containing protein n=2 Tax=Emiliania huxleyi TaxID=2903 RepID=A0A0D3HYB1_EMIH1|mmetsp:Transcript_21805/g.64200  ORF Transcript_21805/g.64200 Transcript_21805/m.64200 type:complete len:233 (+) Transcript_21805:67-765(+)|eukprot:XP_005756425.1 vesicle transport through interaction with t-snares [Emiliania huxleyi CCMP1516]